MLGAVIGRMFGHALPPLVFLLAFLWRHGWTEQAVQPTR
jgi:hypothetical protein